MPRVSGKLASSLSNQFVDAFVFLTRLPFPMRSTLSQPKGRLAKAVWAFPLAGQAVGAIAGAAFAGAAFMHFPGPVCAVLAIAVQMLLTGAMHEDGLADVADGFGGGQTRAQKLEIMRDSRIGTYGVLALLIAFALRVAAIDSLHSVKLVIEAMIAAASVSRGLMVVAMWRLPPARTDGLGVSAGRPEAIDVAVAMVISIAVAVIMPHGNFLLLAMPPVCSAAGAAAIAFLAWRQIGGQTGDVLGATQQVSEIAMLVAFVAVNP